MNRMQIPEPFQPHLASFVQSLKVCSYSPRTIQAYESSTRLFLSYLAMQGFSDILQVVRCTLREYQLWLQQKGYAGWTIVLRLQSVRRFFQHLEKRQIILLNPCNELGSFKTPRHLPKAILSVVEARKVLETPNLSTAVGLRDRAIIEVFYTCGIRLEEMAQLTLADVDCRNGFLRVNQGKCAKDRIVPLGQTACAFVERYLKEVRSLWADPRTQNALWLGSHKPHDQIKSQMIEVMVRRYGRLAGLEHRLTPHVWRHTCASQLVASGASIAYVQRLLGHYSLRTTQIYVRTSIPEIVAMHATAHPRNQAPV
jgi:integrase/recombinase XerD